MVAKCGKVGACPLNSSRSTGMAHSAAACTHKPGSTAGHVELLTSFNGAYSVGDPAGTAVGANKPGIQVATLTFFSIASMLGCEIRPKINVSDRNFGCYGK